MIFEKVTQLYIDTNGILRTGTEPNSFSAYVFNDPYIEYNNKDLLNFISTQEYDSLDKSHYETPLFYCITNNSLYLNLVQFYRFNNTSPCDAKDKTSVLLSKCNIIKSPSKPEYAFANYAGTTDIWLCNAMAQGASKTINITFDYINPIEQTNKEKLHDAVINGRHINAIQDYIGNSKHITGLTNCSNNNSRYVKVNYGPSGRQYYAFFANFAKVSKYDNNIFVVSKITCSFPFNNIGSIAQESGATSDFIYFFSTESERFSGQTIEINYIYRFILNKSKNIIPINKSDSYSNAFSINHNNIEYFSANNLICYTYRKTFLSPRSFYEYKESIQNIDKTKIKEFNNFNDLKVYLTAKYGSAKRIRLDILYNSELYLDKECTKLASVYDNVFTNTCNSITKLLFTKIGTNNILWSKTTAFFNPDGFIGEPSLSLNISNVNFEYYIVNQPMKYKKRIVKPLNNLLQREYSSNSASEIIAEQLTGSINQTITNLFNLCLNGDSSIIVDLNNPSFIYSKQSPLLSETSYDILLNNQSFTLIGFVCKKDGLSKKWIADNNFTTNNNVSDKYYKMFNSAQDISSCPAAATEAEMEIIGHFEGLFITT